MKVQWTVAAMIAAAGIPAVAAAQQTTTPDSAKQGTAPGRTVNHRNESGDTTNSRLRDSLMRNSTNTGPGTAAPAGATAGSSSSGMNSSSSNASEGRATGGTTAPLADSVQSMQAATPGRPVPLTNESGDTARSALKDSLLRASTRTPEMNAAPTTDASSGAAATGAASASGSASANAGGMSRGGSMSLSRSQTRQLQQALNGAGCNAGTADGVMGRRTREAMACARQKNNISGNDNQALFQALGLNFQQ
jgi:hypothetical protein